MKTIYLKARARKLRLPRSRLLAPLFLIGIGLVSLSFVIGPVVFFQIFEAPRLAGGSLTAPIPNVLATSLVNLTGVDYTRASNWFPTVSSQETNKKPVPTYSFSIPKLNIQDAVVSTVSDDLFKNLVHYRGSSLPGEKGNAVIFGHSTLPQFFDPKNYKTIFSTLHTLKVGDKLIAKVEEVTYQYSIFEIKIVDPADISVLSQDYSDSYITVITCTPPGTYWKRLVIKGKLTKLDST